ncbi:abc transporter g family member 34, partial [Quercus suber]
AVLGLIKLLPSKKRAVKILCDNALLLRPPRSGKTTLLQILAGNRDKDLKVCVISCSLSLGQCLWLCYPEIDAFMKATAMAGQETSLVTDYVLKTLGLDICADIMAGDEMTRGISG